MQIYILGIEIWQKNSTFFKLKMGDGRRIEYRFWLYLGVLLVVQRKIQQWDEESHTNTGHVTKTAIFENSRWRTAAILKMALSPYLSRADFDQIWFADANFHSEDGYLTKIEIFQIQDGGRTRYWKSFFDYISVPYWPINAKFGMEKTNHVQI